MRKRSGKLFLSFFTICLLFVSFGVMAFAGYNVNGVYNSQGKIVFTNDTDDVSDDVVFDARDIQLMDSMITDGKELLANSINEYPGTDVMALDTFTNLATAIDNLTTVSDVYYYDKSTEGASCKRYIYEEGSYYLCNEFGVKVSDEPLSGTITIVAKDDASIPASGETLLVKYESVLPSNLSAGSVGFFDKSLFLGSGEDNVNYYNEGYAKGYADGRDDSGEIVYTYHEHGDGYCNQIPVYHEHTSYSGSCYTPIYCGARISEYHEGEKWVCHNYDGNEANFHYFSTYPGSRCTHIDGYNLVCGKTTSTVERYECNMDSSTIVSATIVFK